MANINKIKLSGTSYNIQDSNAARSVTLTQAEYDALQTKDPNVFYIISDSTIDYVTSADTESAITQAVTSVSDSLTAHTANTTVHVTAQDKTNWNSKSDFSGDYDDLTNKPTIPTVPTNVSDFTNDAGYITSDDISGKTNQSDFTAHTANTTVHVTASEKSTWNAKSDFSGNYNDLSNKPTIPTSASQLTNDSGYITSSALNGYATEDYVTAATNDMATKTWVGQQGYLTQHQDISGKLDVSAFNTYSGSVNTQLNSKASESDLNALNDTVTAHTANTTVHVTASEKSTWNAKSDFSGDYDDLSNKPTIPSKTSDLTNDSDFATTGDVQTATNDMATKTWVGQQGYLTQHQDISGKQDVSGMTAYTEASTFTAHTADTTVHVTSAEKATWNAKSDFSGDYNDLTNKPTIPTVPTSNTAFTNDAGYITSDDISGKTNQSDFTAHTADTTIHVTTAQTAAWDAKSDFSGSYNDLTDKPTIPTVPTSNTAFTNDAGYITSSALDGYATIATTSALNNVVTGHTANTTVHVTAADKSAWNAKSDFSGSYNDLTNKLSAGTNITIVDNVISATGGGGGNNVVELTQAQYDALTVKDPNTFYIITDAQPMDISQYYTKTEVNTALNGKIATSAITTTITSSSTNSQVPSAKAVYDTIGDIETLLSQI